MVADRFNGAHYAVRWWRFLIMDNRIHIIQEDEKRDPPPPCPFHLAFSITQFSIHPKLKDASDLAFISSHQKHNDGQDHTH